LLILNDSIIYDVIAPGKSEPGSEQRLLKKARFVRMLRFSRSLDEARTVKSSIQGSPDLLTVDLEDYFHVEAFADRIASSSWIGFPARVHANTVRILQILEEYNFRATFFVLGWVAEHDPELIREIVNAGHEIACHSYAHRMVHTLAPEEFRRDLRRARETIEEAAGTKVLGYRAPTFSIGRENQWALEILAEEGFLYDSSIFPIHHDLYGFPEAPRFAYRVDLKSQRKLFEVPMTTVRIAGSNWPVGGGGYLRLLPMRYTRWAIQQIHEKEHRPCILYFHPWEIDADQPRIGGKWKSRLRHYTGLRSMENRLRALLAGGRYGPMIDFVRQLDSSAETQPWSGSTPAFTP
jgi:polysaccharide deacetylase family protein (PEP-CTERM system associated)